MDKKVLLLAIAAVMEREKYLTHMRVQHASCMPVAAHHVMQHINHHPQVERDISKVGTIIHDMQDTCVTIGSSALHQKTTAIFEGMHYIHFLSF